MLDLQLDEINVINRMDIDIHERRLRQEEEKVVFKHVYIIIRDILAVLQSHSIIRICLGH